MAPGEGKSPVKPMQAASSPLLAEWSRRYRHALTSFFRRRMPAAARGATPQARMIARRMSCRTWVLIPGASYWEGTALVRWSLL
jgi:hypothetical protein